MYDCPVLPALLKQQGVGIKGAGKTAPVVEEVPPLLENGGKIEVQYINDPTFIGLAIFILLILLFMIFFRFGVSMVMQRLQYPVKTSVNSLVGIATLFFTPITLMIKKKTTICAIGLEKTVLR